jgi:restriction system protein
MASTRDQAGLPSYPELTWVTLESMRQMDLPATNDEIDEAVAFALELSQEQQSLGHVNSNKSEVAYRVAWCRTRLNVAGAIENSGRALWTLTDEGRDIGPEEVDRRYAVHLARLKAERELNGSEVSGAPDPDDPDPADWQQLMLQRLKIVSAKGFEHLAAALLRAAGFDDVEVTGRTNDGGIDGIGIYRPSGLISFHTAFQCKRYQGSVGAGTVRDFRGSFVGRADRGIILTTGYFTHAARDEASRAGANPVDLIDGEAFCDLLREHSLGVQTTKRVVEDVTIDDAYFDQFEDAQ